MMKGFYVEIDENNVLVIGDVRIPLKENTAELIKEQGDFTIDELWTAMADVIESTNSNDVLPKHLATMLGTDSLVDVCAQNTPVEFMRKYREYLETYEIAVGNVLEVRATGAKVLVLKVFKNNENVYVTILTKTCQTMTLMYDPMGFKKTGESYSWVDSFVTGEEKNDSD